MVEAMRVFSYFKGSLDDVGMVGPDVGYDLYSVEVTDAFSLCGVLSYC